MYQIHIVCLLKKKTTTNMFARENIRITGMIIVTSFLVFFYYVGN